MFTSIQAGVRAMAKAGMEGIFLIPVDTPLISSDVISCLVENISLGKFLVPTYEGKKGHPLYIPSEMFDEIMNHDGQMGLKGVTDKYPDLMLRVPVGDEGCVMDMDTQDDYAELVAFADAGCKRASVEKLARGRRIVLVRHGETEQHQEPIFIGQIDVPLSDVGRKQTKAAAAALSDFKPSRIYTSDLARACESARIIADGMGVCEIIKVPGFREIALGSWEGKAISKIKEEFPKEYEYRGKNLFSFKIGNKAENFYDMQYRAVKALRALLEEDEGRDIVIVAHSGVIRALENNLRGKRVDDEWNPVKKGDFVII